MQLVVGGGTGGTAMGDNNYVGVPSTRGTAMGNRAAGRGGVADPSSGVGAGLLYSSYNGGSSLRASDDRFSGVSSTGAVIPGGAMEDGDYAENDADDDDLAMLRSANVSFQSTFSCL